MNSDITRSKTDAHAYALVEKIPGGKWLKNLKIGSKLTLGFGLLVLLIFVSAGVSYLGSDRATREINRVADVRAPTALDASRAQANLLRMLSDVRGYLALGDQKYRESYVESARAFEADLDRLYSQLQNLDEANIRRLVRLKIAYDQWAALPEPLFDLRDDQLDREPAYRLLATEGIRYAGQVLIATNTLIELQGQQDATAENLALLSDMAKFQGNFAAMLSALRGYVTTQNRIYRGEYEVNLVDNDNVWERLQNKRAMLTASQQDLLDTIAQNRAEFLTLPDKMFADLEGEHAREDLYLFRTQAVPLADEMQRLLNEMTNDQQDQLTTDLATGRRDLKQTNLIIIGSGIFALLVGIGMAYVTRETIAGPVVRLTDVAERIRAGDLEAQANVESRDEVGVLATTFNNMTTQLRLTLQQVRKEKKRADDLLEVVIPIGVDLTTEKDFNRLLEKMLVEAKNFCHADAGTLYLIEGDQLKFVIVRNDSHGVAMGGTTGNPITYSPLPLVSQTSAETAKIEYPSIAVQVALTGQTSNIPQHDQSSAIVGDYKIESLLTIPLKNSAGQVLGVLQLINAEEPATEKCIPFDENLQQMMESFSSLAVAALEAYIREQALRRQIQELRIEIDQAKKERQVAEITESDYFQGLRQKARELRSRSE
ncbi:MAG TPA: MCP four helix bundle domain-containing protein [Anaerolineae bacterium]|nr:MCP four helix bundle domain-containing protein [Anaerolineae bacterium]HQK12796.1 MCP four helix bundle domain-containing protein [Anaerolineae bacterium]